MSYSAIRFVRRQRWAVGLLMLSGCRDLVDPPLPDNAELLTPPPVYSTWWSMVEACSGLQGSLSTITWYVVPGAPTIGSDGRNELAGYWSEASNRIVLAGAHSLEGGPVRHEMLHALLRVAGHPRSEFLGACEGVVDCQSACIADAGLPPPFDPSALRVSEDDLELSITVSPTHPSATIDGGFLAVTVRATNPRADPILVALPPGGIDKKGPSETFVYYLPGPGGGVQGAAFALDSADIRFAPHQSREQVFDFVIGGPLLDRGAFLGSLVSLPPGGYRLTAGYGHHLLSDTLQIGP